MNIPKNGISISDGLGLLHSGATCDIVAVTLDLKRRTGGRRIVLEQARKTGSNHDTKEEGTITVQETMKSRRAYPVTLHVCLIESINGRPLL